MSSQVVFRMFRASIVGLLAFFPWFTPLTARGATSVVISEFMASNTSGIKDEDGTTSDWIELFNAGSASVNLSGWRLTDNAADLSKWVIPSTNLPPNGFLLVWASGKNRALPGAPLHANFSLGSSGEYLALVRPDDSLASEFNPYPKQYDNISYGVVQQIETSSFLTTNSTGRVFIPTNNALGTTWTGRTFTDSSWQPATNGIGYEASVPGFAVKNYKANVIVGSLAAADAVIATPAQQSAVYSENRGVINYFNSGGVGNYGGDSPFPGFDLVTDQEDFVVEATAVVTIPAAGNWTFGVNSDDGFRLQLGTFTMSYPDPRGSSDTLATFNIPAAGDYSLRLVFYERGGGSELEFFAGQGSYGAWDSTHFRLVGDTAGGGLSVRSLPQGQTGGIRPLVKTDLINVMSGKASSAYERLPFNVPNPSALSTLTLRAKYDDGFVAYLNGTEVARRNAPGVVTYNSVSLGERPQADVAVYETIDLTSQLSSLVAGQNVLAVQGLNKSSSDSDFLQLFELAEIRTTLSTNQFFATATPSGYNSTSFYNKVRDTHFSHDRGFYSTNFNLTITCDTPGAIIRYTVDGTAPSPTAGALYSAPIPIQRTTTVRAMAYKTGMVPSDVDTQTYLYTADIITQSPTGAAPPGWPASWGANSVDYGMDPDITTKSPWKDTIQDDLKSIPSFSVVMNLTDLFDPGTGIYANPGNDTISWERPCSLELITPDGKGGFHENCGIRIRGGFSRTTSNPKHAFRFFFRQEYGAPKLNYPLFGSSGAKEFDKFDLRTTQNYSWAFQGDAGSIFLRDQFSRDTQLDMGQQGERGNWFHLYINGVYWGLYNTDERAEAAFGETYLGGAAEDYDTIKVGPDQGYTIYATDGNTDAWLRLWQSATNGYASDVNYYRVQGLNPDGTPNPSYETLLDVPNLIDYMLVIYYGGNLDAPISQFLGNGSPNNWFGFRDRTGAHGGFRFISHDAEHTLLNVGEDRTGPFAAGDPLSGSDFSKSNPQYIFTRLWANAEFRMTCADRIQKHFFNGGALTVSNAQHRLDRRTNEIFRALVPESARWGDAQRGAGAPITRNDWQDAYNNVRNNYIPARGNIVLDQLRNKGLYPNLSAVNFSQQGGYVPFGYSLVLSHANASGSIYYTLDGTDPRLRGGAINPAAAVYSAPLTLNTAQTIRARVKNGTTWSAITEATFYPLQSFAGLSITEIMYNPPGEGAVSGDEFEFIEIKNTTQNPIELSGLAFTAGIDFTFTQGTVLLPGKFFVLARNLAQFQSRYPGVKVDGIYTGKLDNGGELIRLKHVLGGTVFTLTYSDSQPWPIPADGFGFSLVQKNPSLGLNPEDGTRWRASASRFGSPGADDPESNIPGILINELLTHTDLPQLDSIELYNPTDAPVDIGGWFLTDDAASPTKYRIPANTIISARGYKVFDEDQFNADLTSSNAFRLSSVGDQVYLLSGGPATNLTGYSYGVDFGAAQNGVSFGRYVNSQGEEHFPAQLTLTLGATNSGPRVGPVVINEIQYHPPPLFDEFVELQNITQTNVPLYDPAAATNTWKITGLNFTFPTNVSIPAGGYLLLSPIDPATFRTRYGVPAAVQIFGPYTGGLQDSGERLSLLRPDPPNTNLVPYLIVDSVRYNDKLPWPVSADGSGPSLQRSLATAYADDPTNWFASGITPGRPNLPNQAPTVALTAPLDGSDYTPPATVEIAATAADADGSIQKVEFFADGVKLGEDTVAPYTWTWNNAPAGTHSLTARATDNGFSTTLSDPVEVVIFAPTPVTILPSGSTWRYLDKGVYPGDTWIQASFNDSAWSSGAAQLGYGDGDEATVVGFGPDSNNKYITTWFRRQFSITNVARYLSLGVSVLRDDGVVVYLNGSEIFRSNMPDGTILPTTLALGAVGGGDETSTYYSGTASASLLREGDNILAVEIHQASPTSSDISFDLRLESTLAPNRPSVQITSPVAGASLVAPANIAVSANANDAENGISRVDFYANNTRIGQDLREPFGIDWNAVPAGSYILQAVAVNGVGLSRTSAPVSVSVIANQAPIVTWVQPTAGSTLVNPGSVTLEATASDPDGSITKVEFFADGQKLGEDTSSPYTWLWTTPTAGQHQLKAVATDNRGVSASTPNIPITITNKIVAPFILLSERSLWSYHDRGIDLGTEWIGESYDDSGWSNGVAQLGYSPDEGDEATVLQFGPVSAEKYPTYYFRHRFQVPNPADLTDLKVRFQRDDGLVIYLNGAEILRDNMPAGPIGYSTLAVNNISTGDESAWTTNSLNTSLLKTGWNTLAVELHQQNLGSSDISFDAELFATGPVLAPQVEQAPQPATIPEGGNVLLSVVAHGTASLEYQWRKAGLALPLATNLSLRLTNVSQLDAGNYDVVISNPGGSITSTVALITVTTGGGDQDGDGMPDDWEDRYGLDKRSAADALLDRDGDGLTNLDEYLAGTDPTVATSSFRIQAVIDGSTVRVEFQGVSGRSYAVQYRDSVEDTVWKTLQDVPTRTSDGLVQVVDPLPSGHRFYRVQLTGHP